MSMALKILLAVFAIATAPLWIPISMMLEGVFSVLQEAYEHLCGERNV
jgi:hypothetical protein